MVALQRPDAAAARLREPAARAAQRPDPGTTPLRRDRDLGVDVPRRVAGERREPEFVAVPGDPTWPRLPAPERAGSTRPAPAATASTLPAPARSPPSRTARARPAPAGTLPTPSEPRSPRSARA